MKDSIIAAILLIVSVVILAAVWAGKIDPNGALYHLALLASIFGGAFLCEKVKV